MKPSVVLVGFGTSTGVALLRYLVVVLLLQKTTIRPPLILKDLSCGKTDRSFQHDF